ncbi:hypothetical protein [Streptomyces canus]|uniref:hypothetical protein n=1 Tax=Streptomyces canus TaxID=58343 RepID=UPI0027885581|nr:hypothetical protein [Streptomyces canus]MDQ0764967.1 hypothetical protein [Streptomyces canus]
MRQLAEQAVGRITTWTDASWARDRSRVWRADGAQAGVWYVKIHQNTRFHHREVDARVRVVTDLVRTLRNGRIAQCIHERTDIFLGDL